MGKQNKYGEEVVERKKKGNKNRKNKKKETPSNKIQMDIAHF